MTYCQDFVVGFPPSGHRYMSPGCDRKTRSGVTLVIGLTKVILSCIKITQRAHFVFKLTETRNQDFKQRHIILKKKLPSQPPTPNTQTKNKKAKQKQKNTHSTKNKNKKISINKNTTKNVNNAHFPNKYEKVTK